MKVSLCVLVYYVRRMANLPCRANGKFTMKGEWQIWDKWNDFVFNISFKSSVSSSWLPKTTWRWTNVDQNKILLHSFRLGFQEDKRQKTKLAFFKPLSIFPLKIPLCGPNLSTKSRMMASLSWLSPWRFLGIVLRWFQRSNQIRLFEILHIAEGS